MTAEDIRALYAAEEARLEEAHEAGTLTDAEFRAQLENLYRLREDALADAGYITGPTWRDIVDRRTAARIRSRVHSLTPVDEQLALLRAQLVALANAHGWELLPEFVAFNQAAVEEVNVGAAEKATEPLPPAAP